ncbi:MAG: hypothetical protein OEW08_02915 [Gammaproteobacteria bacterium]|nr:hypothetical protein [Gammaproteobacteria bacterium]
MLAQQRGSFLIQLLVTLGIIGILTVLTVPNLKPIIVRQDLESGQNTFIQTLHKAKWLARSRGTLVDLSLAQGSHSIQLSSTDLSVSEVVTLPAHATVAQGLALRVLPSGEITSTTPGAVQGGDITITLLPTQFATADADAVTNIDKRTVTISALGSIAGI